MSFPRPFYRWRPHPWHGLEPGEAPPELVTAFIEITPRDVVKYEVHKETGYVKVDRPQRFSSSPPTLYGFIPRTYCGERVAALSPGCERADGDPLDICVISERPIDRAEILVDARVVGGLRMVDGGEADDKVLAVLVNDPVWGGARDLHDVPAALVERLVHYFLTYKQVPGQGNPVRIDPPYGRDAAFAVIRASMQDYEESFGKDA
jgi:inorganic pyrophosphatase